MQIDNNIYEAMIYDMLHCPCYSPFCEKKYGVIKQTDIEGSSCLQINIGLSVVSSDIYLSKYTINDIMM